MTVRRVVVYDANVLYPAQLRDLLMRLAVAGLVQAHWTDDIHAEWMRSVLERHPDIVREQIDRTRQLMEQALPAARVEGYERHVPTLLLPDPDDRHVLAAAIESRADAIVTFNLNDFPSHALESYEIRALHPDLFVHRLLIEESASVLQVMRSHRRSLRRPPKSSAVYLDVLERAGLKRTVDRLRTDQQDL